jgi:hypothetical protein
MIGAFAVMLFDMPLTRCDMWFIHSQALELSKGFPAFISYYPYLFSIYLSMISAVSGLHSALTMQMLYIFSFMPVLGFYSMVKQWFREKRNEKISSVATYFSILLGFGSLYLLYSKVVNPEYTFSYLASLTASKTYDSYMRFPFAPYMVVARWNVGLTVLFLLLYLLKNDSCKSRSLLFALLVAIGYLGHIVEVMLFIPLLLVWTIFFQANSNWKVSFSILLGFLTVGIIDFLAPRQIYVLSMNNLTGKNSISPTYAISVLIVTLLLGVEIAKRKGLSVLEIRQRIFSIVEKTWRYMKWLLLYSYLFSVSVWLYVVKDHNLWLYGDSTFVPFFIFPVRWGAIGLLAILSIVFYLPEIIKNNELSFFTMVFAIGVFLEQLLNYFPIFYADIGRYAAIICIGASIIAAYGMERMLHDFTKKFSSEKMISIFLIFLLITASALSTAVYYTHMTYLNDRREVISDNELEALEYIKNNLSPEESVLTFTYDSAFKLGTFAGVSFQSLYPFGTSDQDRNIVHYGFLETGNPYIITYMLGASNTRYIYVAKNDATLLSSKYFLINSFLKYLPEVFKSSDVTLYEVPKLIPPSPNLDSSLGVIHLFPSKKSLSFDDQSIYRYLENDSFIALLMSLLGSRYSILYADDVLTEHLDMYLSNHTCVILTSDPKAPFSNILNWVSAGHTLVVFNINNDDDGFFARLLDLNFSSGNLINVKGFNSGKIVYVDIQSLLVSCEEHKLLSQTNFINMVKNAFYIPSYNASTSTIRRPGVTFNMTYGEFEVIGNLSLFTDLLVLKNATLLSPNFTYNKTFTISVYEKSTLNIQNATLFVFPSESYLLVKPENNLILGQILVNSKVMLKISDSVGSSTIMNETQKVLNFQAEELLAKLPAVNASGEIIFKSLYTHVSPYTPLAGIVLQKAKVQGNVKFDTMYISDPLTIFSMFQAEGKIVNLDETTSRLTIPWAEVLISPYNIAFNVFFLLGVATQILKKKKVEITEKEIET